MKLVRLVFGHAPWAMTGVLLFSTASAVLNVAVIAFINDAWIPACAMTASATRFSADSPCRGD